MKIIGFNGKEYSWNLAKYSTVKNKDRSSRSQYHLRARAILSDLFHSYTILEEVKLPGSVDAHKKSVLYFDFYIPNLKLAVEVHGQQHYQYSPFFHKNRRDFSKAENRDDDKRSWCELNDIELVVLKYSETDDEWREQLRRK